MFATFTPRAAVCPEGTIGEGRKFFAAIEARGLEGMVCKRLDSRYLPGERTDAWLKVKCERRLHCLILGFEPEEGEVVERRRQEQLPHCELVYERKRLEPLLRTRMDRKHDRQALTQFG